MLKHYVEYAFPGSLFPELSYEEVAERNPELITVPEGAFAYRFFDVEEIVLEGEVISGEKKNFSPYTYFGTVYTLEEVKAQFPQYDILISNMESNKWDKVVKTCMGNWRPVLEGDIVI